MEYIYKKPLKCLFLSTWKIVFLSKNRKKIWVLAQTLIEIYFMMIKTESFYVFPTTEVISKVKISSCK